jgi:hypothetical protein
VAAISIYFYVQFFGSRNIVLTQEQAPNQQSIDDPRNKEELISPEEDFKVIEQEYPEALQGVIIFSDKGGVFKATIRTQDGKEYILLPPQPSAVYESFGVKSGEKIEIRAKISQDNTINWALMKPAK